MAKCYMKNCKRKAKRRFTGGDEGVLCTKHWLEMRRVMKEMGR